MFRSARSSRFPQGKGRWADPSNMARTMEIFGIEVPPQHNPQEPVLAEQSSKKQEHISPDAVPLAHSKRGLIRIVTDEEVEKLQAPGAPFSSVQGPSSRPVEGPSHPVDANATTCVSNVLPNKNVSVPAAYAHHTFVPPITSTPMSSLKELLEHVLKEPCVDSEIVGMTISMRLKNGDTLIVDANR